MELERTINKSSNINLNQWHLNNLMCFRVNDKFEIDLSGHNILNLNRQEWASVSYNGIYVAEKNFRQIPGNILLKLNYRF